MLAITCKDCVHGIPYSRLPSLPQERVILQSCFLTKLFLWKIDSNILDPRICGMQLKPINK